MQSPEEKGYLKAREISILIDMLRVLDNPTLDTPLAAVMLSPMFWFTPEELMQIRMLAKKSKLFHAVQMRHWCGRRVRIGKAGFSIGGEVPASV